MALNLYNEPSERNIHLQPSDPKTYRALISGYYGFDNLGDELILQTLLQELKVLNLDITVLSSNPKRTTDLYGVRAISRAAVLDIIDEMRETNLFISGGGGLFQDVTGPKSVFYYGGLIYLAKFFEVPSFFWGQGVGPLKSKLSKRVTARAIVHCRGMTVRDGASADLVDSLINTRPEVTADPVWLLNLPNRVSMRRRIETWNIGVSLRPWKTLTTKRIKAFAAFLKRLTADSERDVKFYLFPFQQKEDTEVLRDFESALADEGLAERVEWVAPDNVLTTLVECHVMFGMRYHSLVLAMLAKVPVYGLSYDPKVENLLKSLELKGTPVEALDSIEEKSVREYFAEYKGPDLKAIHRQAAVNVVRLTEMYYRDVVKNPASTGK